MALIFKYKRHVLALRAEVVGVWQFKKLIFIRDSTRKEIAVFFGVCRGLLDRQVIVEGYFLSASGATCSVFLRVVTYKEFTAIQANGGCIARVHEIRESPTDENIVSVKSALTEAP
jgi:hypothetical protein